MNVKGNVEKLFRKSSHLHNQDVTKGEGILLWEINKKKIL